MSQLPDDTLRKVRDSCSPLKGVLTTVVAKILLQIQQTAVQSQRALSVTRAQASAKERERRILQLTIDEIHGIEGNVNMYKGVGKM
jgi:prefoldin subunit 1